MPNETGIKEVAPAFVEKHPPSRPKRGRLLPPLFGLLAICAIGWVILTLTVLPSPGALAAPEATPTATLPPNMGAVVGAAWLDSNGDGLRDAEEPPLSGVTIDLFSHPAGQFIFAATTDPTGSYTLAPLSPGMYRVVASGPAGYLPTTVFEQLVYVSPGLPLILADFGFRFVPSPTPTPTSIPMLDTESAQAAVCGGIIWANTQTGSRNVDRYGCKPEWDETGPELVYRLELGRSQLLSASFLTTTVDLDLFLMPSAYPDSCLQAGDNYLSQQIEPGVYFVVVDGYRGVAGDFALRIECPLALQATPTVTSTPSPTPTITQTPTRGPTATPTPTREPLHVHLPLVLHSLPTQPLATATVSFQQDIDGYQGASDTTLDSWEPERNSGTEALFRLRYNRSGGGYTEMAPIIRFDLSVLPRGADVMTATLRLYLEEKSNTNDFRAELRGLLRGWDEFSATWQQAATGLPWAVPGAQGAQDRMAWADDIQVIGDAGAWYSLDATQLTQMWLDDPTSNYGAILLAKGGTYDANVEARFASRDASTAGQHPQLIVTYSAPLTAAEQ